MWVFSVEYIPGRTNVDPKLHIDIKVESNVFNDSYLKNLLLDIISKTPD